MTQVPVNPIEGITNEQAAKVVEGLKVTGDSEAAKEQIKALFRLFEECDCTMVEVNPLAEDSSGLLLAADAKVFTLKRTRGELPSSSPSHRH